MDGRIDGWITDECMNESIAGSCCADCGHCGELQCCGFCSSIYYCSRQCQKNHWWTHRLLCKTKVTVQVGLGGEKVKLVETLRTATLGGFKRAVRLSLDMPKHKLIHVLCGDTAITTHSTKMYPFFDSGELFCILPFTRKSSSDPDSLPELNSSSSESSS